MRNPEDLSGKDGELILVEFTEEHPPLMNQVSFPHSNAQHFLLHPNPR